MRSSLNIIASTAAGNKTAGISKAFYWVRPVTDFPAADSVLGDTNRNFYALHAALRELASHSEDGYRALCIRVHLNTIMFGRVGARVKVWGCVIESIRFVYRI
jgi:hypothetical protein